MDTTESCESITWSRRRNEAKRRRIEAAVEGLARRYRLTPNSAKALSDGIYRLYRGLVATRSFDDQDRHYRRWTNRALHKLAIRTTKAFDTDVSPYVADVREFAAHIIRLESLERRNLGRGKAIEQASKVTWPDLSPQERHKARQYPAGSVLRGDRTRQHAREVDFLRSVAHLIERATKHRIRFSSNALGSSRPRHHGVEFDAMMAAAEMADYQLTNEAMARLIQRIRRH